jgi:hypothetical protein
MLCSVPRVAHGSLLTPSDVADQTWVRFRLFSSETDRFCVARRRGASLACKPAPLQQPARRRGRASRSLSTVPARCGRAGAQERRVRALACYAGVGALVRWRLAPQRPHARAQPPPGRTRGTLLAHRRRAAQRSACRVRGAQRPRCAGGPAGGVSCPAKITAISDWNRRIELTTSPRSPPAPWCEHMRVRSDAPNDVSTEHRRRGTEPHAHAAGAYRRRLHDAVSCAEVQRAMATEIRTHVCVAHLPAPPQQQPAPPKARAQLL